MSELFAKIFEIDKKHQVLVTTDSEDNEDNEGGDFLIRVRTDITGMSIIITLGYFSEEERDEKFKEYAHEDALKFYKAAQELVS